MNFQQFQTLSTFPGGGTSPSTLLLGLVSYWKLEEASGSRIDVLGANNLAPRTGNTPGRATGIQAYGLDLESGVYDYLFKDSASGLAVTGSFFVSAWCKFEASPPGTKGLVAYATSAAARSWMILYSTGGTAFRFQVHNAAAANIGQVDVSLTPVVGNWYHLLAWYDADTAKIWLRVNGGVAQSANVTGTVNNANNLTVQIGTTQKDDSLTFDGLIDEVGIWRDRTPTAAEQTNLYNGGSGITYPFDVAAGAAVASVSMISADGYANTVSINGAQHQAEAIISREIGGVRHQVTGWWDANGYMRLATRNLPGGNWEIYTYDGAGGLPTIGPPENDGHNVVALGIDSDGYIHVAYDHHNDPLNYRTSANPINTFDGALSNPKLMLGTARESTAVTYPYFFNDPSGDLYFMVRMDGGTGEANLYFYVYDTATTTWSAAAGTGTEGILIDGINGEADPALNYSPYWNHPVFDAGFGTGGFMHLCWMWRENENSSSNANINYLRWDGVNWTTISGTAATIPATYANTVGVIAVAQNNGLTNNPEMDVDGGGNLHITYVKHSGESTASTKYSALWHSYYDGSWSHHQIAYTLVPDISGPLADMSKFARPRIIVDRSTGRCIVFGRDFTYGNGIYAWLSDDNGASWARTILYASDAGEAEPTLDFTLWGAGQGIAMQICPWSSGGTRWPIYILEWTP